MNSIEEESVRDIVHDALDSSLGATDTNERVAEALSQLDHARTTAIRDLLLETAEAIRSEDVDAQLSCSTSLAQLLSEQLVSGQEVGLYNVCRVAWDHAHVGKQLQQMQGELDHLVVLQMWDSKMREIMQGLERAEGGLGGYRDVMRHVEDIHSVQLDDESKRRELESVEERVRCVVKKGLLGGIGFQGGMPVAQDVGEPLGALWECCSVLDIVDDVAKDVSHLIYDSCIRGLMKKMGDSYPAGYREKVLYKMFKGVAESIASGDAMIVETLGRYLWSLVGKMYVDMVDKGEIGLKQMMFAKKLEVKASVLGFLPKGEKGPVAVAMGEYVKEELVRRRAATITRVRDALIIPLQDQKVISFEKNGCLGPWDGTVSAEVLQHVSDTAMHDTFHVMEEDVFEELKARDTPLGVCESTLSVLESYTKTVDYVVEEFKKTSELSDGQYVYFVNSVMEDVSSLIVALVDFDIQKNSLITYQASLVYMSCLYLSRCFSLLIFTGRMSVHSQLCGHLAGERIRRLGEDVFNVMIESHKANISEDVLEICSWRQQEDAQDIIRMKKSVQKIRHAFRRLGASLSGQDIPDWLFFRVISTLIEDSLRPILESILDLGDISEDLSENIPRVLEDLVSHGDDDLQQHNLLECALRGKYGDDLQTLNALSGSIPVMQKLSEVCEVMRLTSRDIVERWNQGSLSSFSRQEVIMLIQALFEDTPQVRSSLVMLQDDM